MKKWIIPVAAFAISLNAQAASPLAQLSWIGSLPLLSPAAPTAGLSLLAGLPNFLLFSPSTLPALAGDLQPILADFSAGGVNALLSLGSIGSVPTGGGSSSTLPGLKSLPLGGLVAQVISSMPVLAPLAVQSIGTGTLPDLLRPR
jgi:hypothetical protein